MESLFFLNFHFLIQLPEPRQGIVMRKDISLNAGQQAAADGVFSWLFTDQPEMIISGAGGVGKSFLMGYLIDKVIPEYEKMCDMLGQNAEFTEVHMTATTNKAAEVLSEATGRPCSTIHSFLGLKVFDDFSTGESKLTKTDKWKVHSNIILFVDECPMISRQLLRYIREGTHNCKIIFVGDHNQLTPVKENSSPIYGDNLPFFELTEPMRNKDQPALKAVCAQLRNTVETGIFNPIVMVPGVVDWLNDDEMQEELSKEFVDGVIDARILVYSNARAQLYNEFVRNVRQLPAAFVAGEQLISNTAFRTGSGSLSVEEPVSITEISPKTEVIRFGDGAELEIHRINFTSAFRMFVDVPFPVNQEHFQSLIKHYRQKKNWKMYFHLKEQYPDLRQRDSCTVHKSQGSTYDTVYIDMANLSTCTQPDQAARLLYVAFTRARNRVVMYGKLADKFGGIRA